MWFVHRVSTHWLSDQEYASLVTFIRSLNLMAIPVCGVQAFFAQKTARVASEQEKSDLAALVYKVSLGIFLFWILSGVGIFFCQVAVLAFFKLSSEFLIATLLVFLLVLLRPVGMGLLQGNQNFFWFGWSQIFDGALRFFSILFILFLFHGNATSAVYGVLIGILVCVIICAWQSKSLWWSEKRGRCQNKVIAELLPMTLATGIPLLMLSVDSLVVKAYFSETDVAVHSAAGVVAGALYFFIYPVTIVMFPKIAQKANRSEKKSVLFSALAVTLVVGLCAVVGSYFFRGLIMKVMFADQAYLAPVKNLIPWFTLATLPLALALVLISNLMARGRYWSVPYLIVVSIGYVLSLMVWHENSSQVIMQTGLFNGLLLLVSAFLVSRR